MKKLSYIAFIFILCLTFTLAACGTGDITSGGSDNSSEITTPDADDTPSDTGNTGDETTDTNIYEVEAPGEGLASASNISSVDGVPLVTRFETRLAATWRRERNGCNAKRC